MARTAKSGSKMRDNMFIKYRVVTDTEGNIFLAFKSSKGHCNHVPISDPRFLATQRRLDVVLNFCFDMIGGWVECPIDEKERGELLNSKMYEFEPRLEPKL